MFFTQEDYLKIEKWLKARAVKDSQFDEVLDINNISDEDYIIFIKNGINKKIKLNNFISGTLNRIDFSDYAKIADCVDLTSEQKITAEKTFSGGINMNNTRIHKVKIPAMYDDAANKQYVDGTVSLANNAVQIKYTDLKSLRDAGKLVPGTQYRITDYTCTTTQANTKSAGHQFDIIVTADDEGTLNEVARAVKHEGDTYFANNDLNAWKIWYCLDNDTERFAWADETETDGKPNGRGVIYRMIDEFNNDVPYDFKNIQFYRQWDSSKSLWCTISSDTTGVPCYTFSSSGYGSTTSFTDQSLASSNNVYSNVIGKYVSRNKQTLNNNCFFGNNCYSNSFGNNCRNNTFGNSFQANTFGNDCWYNTFGNNCSRNTFGNDCYCINFAADSSASIKYGYYRYNHLGDGCQYILFKSTETASSFSQVQNYNFAQGLQGTDSAYLIIDGVRNRAYETKVAKNSNEELKIYCEADLIL